MRQNWTTSTAIKDGWVYTGDLGFIDDDGYLVLAGRKKDIIIRGGVNISPAQIENIAVSHPAVVSAACVPVPDPDLGHRVCLCLALRDGAERPSLSQFTHYLHEKGLDTNKLPEYLRYYRQLPLSPAGKIDKKRLSAEVEFSNYTTKPASPNLLTRCDCRKASPYGIGAIPVDRGEKVC